MIMPTDAATPGLGAIFNSIFPFILIFAVMLYMPWNSQRKEKKKKEEMLSNLKKGLKIRTIGGIVGKLEEVKNEDVVIVIDEKNNTRMTIAKVAIASVAAEGDVA